MHCNCIRLHSVVTSTVCTHYYYYEPVWSALTLIRQIADGGRRLHLQSHPHAICGLSKPFTAQPTTDSASYSAFSPTPHPCASPPGLTLRPHPLAHPQATTASPPGSAPGLTPRPHPRPHPQASPPGLTPGLTFTCSSFSCDLALL